MKEVSCSSSTYLHLSHWDETDGETPPQHIEEIACDELLNAAHASDAVLRQLQANDNRLAKDIAQWKEAVAERWDAIHVVSKDDSVLYGAETGKKYTMRYVIDEAGLNDAVGLELVSITKDENGNDRIYNVRPFKVVKQEGNQYTFEATFEPDVAGSFKSCVRMFPKNENLPHRQDFCYVKWLD